MKIHLPIQPIQPKTGYFWVTAPLPRPQGSCTDSRAGPALQDALEQPPSSVLFSAPWLWVKRPVRRELRLAQHLTWPYMYISLNALAFTCTCFLACN